MGENDKDCGVPERKAKVADNVRRDRFPDERIPAGEIDIVWVMPRQEAIKLCYVRESHTTGWRRKPNHPRLIAYAVKRRMKYPSSRLRRLWYLADHDPYEGRGGPYEAVDPRSIFVGKESLGMTTDQWERTGEFAEL